MDIGKVFSWLKEAFSPANWPEWEDKEVPLTEREEVKVEGKKVVREIAVIGSDGKPVCKVIPGRKRGFGKRFFYFFFPLLFFLFLAVLSFFMTRNFYFLALVLFGEVITGAIFFFRAVEQEERKKILKKGLLILGITLFLSFLGKEFIVAASGIAFLAALVFLAEEMSGKNLYPHLVMGIGIVILGLIFLNGVYHLTTVYPPRLVLGQQANLSPFPCLVGKQVFPANIRGMAPPPLVQQLGASGQGALFYVQKVASCFLATLAWLTGLVIFFVLAAPDIAMEWWQRKGFKKKKTSKEGGKEDPYWFLMIWNLFQDLIRILGKKE